MVMSYSTETCMPAGRYALSFVFLQGKPDLSEAGLLTVQLLENTHTCQNNMTTGGSRAGEGHVPAKYMSVYCVHFVFFFVFF